MKANEMPERIYIYDYNDAMVTPLEGDTVYVREDAFIEKAVSWLKNHYRDYMHNPTGERLEAFFGGDMCNDFENYMREM